MEIGDKILFDEQYLRAETMNEEGDWERNWTVHKINRTKGVFVGTRTLKNGKLSSLPQEVLFRWNITKYIKVALIAVNKKQLIYAPFESIIRTTSKN